MCAIESLKRPTDRDAYEDTRCLIRRNPIVAAITTVRTQMRTLVPIDGTPCATLISSP